MKTLLLAEYKKLHRSKLIFLLVFALMMTLGVVFLQGQFSFGGKKYIDTFGYEIYFQKKYNLINGFEEDYKAGRKTELYAKRVGLVELIIGIILTIFGICVTIIK